MKKELRFVNMPEDRGINKFIKKKISTIENLFTRNYRGLKFNLSSSDPNVEKAKDFSCEVIYFENGAHRSIKKTRPSIYRAVSDCVLSLKRQLSSEVKRIPSTRKEKRKRIYAKRRGLLVA